MAASSDRFHELTTRALAKRTAFVLGDALPPPPPPVLSKADVLGFLERLEQRKRRDAPSSPAVRPRSPPPAAAAALSSADVATLQREDVPFTRCAAYLDRLSSAPSCSAPSASACRRILAELACDESSGSSRDPSPPDATESAPASVPPCAASDAAAPSAAAAAPASEDSALSHLAPPPFLVRLLQPGAGDVVAAVRAFLADFSRLDVPALYAALPDPDAELLRDNDGDAPRGVQGVGAESSRGSRAVSSGGGAPPFDATTSAGSAARSGASRRGSKDDSGARGLCASRRGSQDIAGAETEGALKSLAAPVADSLPAPAPVVPVHSRSRTNSAFSLGGGEKSSAPASSDKSTPPFAASESGSAASTPSSGAALRAAWGASAAASSAPSSTSAPVGGGSELPLQQPPMPPSIPASGSLHVSSTAVPGTVHAVPAPPSAPSSARPPPALPPTRSVAGTSGRSVRATPRPPRPKGPDEFVLAFLGTAEEMLRSHPLWRSDAAAGGAAWEATCESLERFVLGKVHALVFGTHPLAAARDAVYASRLGALSFVTFRHLDLPEPSRRAAPGWLLAQSALRALDAHDAPCDKLACIMNACRIISTLLALAADEAGRGGGAGGGGAVGADEFLPALIYTVIHAAPRRLYSNLRFIGEFSNQRRLMSEQGYFFTNVSSAVAFARAATAAQLNMAQAEFSDRLRASRAEWGRLHSPSAIAPPRPAPTVEDYLALADGREVKGDVAALLIRPTPREVSPAAVAEEVGSGTSGEDEGAPQSQSGNAHSPVAQICTAGSLAALRAALAAVRVDMAATPPLSGPRRGLPSSAEAPPELRRLLECLGRLPHVNVQAVAEVTCGRVK